MSNIFITWKIVIAWRHASPLPPSTRTKCPTYSRYCWAPCRTGGLPPSSYSDAVSSRLRWPHNSNTSRPWNAPEGRRVCRLVLRTKIDCEHYDLVPVERSGYQRGLLPVHTLLFQLCHGHINILDNNVNLFNRKRIVFSNLVSVQVTLPLKKLINIVQKTCQIFINSRG